MMGIEILKRPGEGLKNGSACVTVIMSGNVKDMRNTQRDYKGTRAKPVAWSTLQTHCNIDQSKLIEYSGFWQGVYMGETVGHPRIKQKSTT